MPSETLSHPHEEVIPVGEVGPAFAGYIDKAQISTMLQAFGVDMTHPLAASFVLGAFDVMAVSDLASSLPEPMSLANAASAFHTMRHAQPAEVRDVQILVLDRLRTICAPMSDERYQVIRSALALQG